MLRGILGGVVGAAVGMAIWVLIGYTTQYEIGWIAWGIGFLVGFGVRFGASSSGQDEGVMQGLVAAAMAIGAIVAAKFLLYSLLVSGNSAEEIRQFVESMAFDDEAMVAGIADEMAQEMMDRGQTITWPAGMTYDEASVKEDYPPDLWRRAESRWNGLGAEEQKKQKLQAEMMVSMIASAATPPPFSDSFSPWDLLWFGLATFTAFRIGVGAYGDD